MRLGSAFLGPGFYPIRPLADPMFSNGLEHSEVIGSGVGELPRGPEAAKGAERLQSPLETELPRLTRLSLGGLCHGQADQIIDEEVSPDFLADHLGRLAA